jgi:hypothetical protein
LDIWTARLAFARLSIVIFGCVGIIWGIQTLPLFQQQSPVERTAANIISGEPYKREVLLDLISSVEAIRQARWCSPAALYSLTIVQLRLLESNPTATERTPSSAQAQNMRAVIGQSLSCSPADPFLWLVLFGMQNSGGTVTQRQIALLRLSYELGPNEGWIAVKRNPVVIGLFGQLPSDLKKAALDEFSRIVEMSHVDGARILTGPGWPIRDILLPTLANIDEHARQGFASDLKDSGYNISVPGIAPSIHR